MRVAVLALMVLAGCSVTDSRPSAFEDLAEDEIGCTITYGSDSTTEIDPIGVGEVQTFEPNDWTSFRIRNNGTELWYSVRTEKSGASGNIAFDEFPEDGVIRREEMIDPGNPGYRIHCWVGPG